MTQNWFKPSQYLKASKQHIHLIFQQYQTYTYKASRSGKLTKSLKRTYTTGFNLNPNRNLTRDCHLNKSNRRLNLSHNNRIKRIYSTRSLFITRNRSLWLRQISSRIPSTFSTYNRRPIHRFLHYSTSNNLTSYRPRHISINCLRLNRTILWQIQSSISRNTVSFNSSKHINLLTKARTIITNLIPNRFNSKFVIHCLNSLSSRTGSNNISSRYN